MASPQPPERRPGGAFLAALLFAIGLFLPSPAGAAATGWVGDRHAEARLITAEQATGSAGVIDAGLEIRLAPGWHAYWRDPGAAGIPPHIAWHGSDNLRSAELSWPAPRRFALDGLQTYAYEGTVILPIAARVARPGAPLLLHASVDYSACRNVCIPYHAAFDLRLPAGVALPGPEAKLIAAARADLPGDLADLGLFLVSARVVPTGQARSELVVALGVHGSLPRHPDLFVEGLPEGAPGPPLVSIATDPEQVLLALPGIGAAAPSLAGRTLTFTLTDGPGRAATFRAAPVLAAAAPDGRGGVIIPLAIVLGALLGGLILNVMPCVLPVLSIKLLALASLAGADRRIVRLDLLASAAGVLAAFAVLAGGLIALKAGGAAIGWGIQFQSPWFLAAMTLVMVLFAADLWGWITIGPPHGALAAAGRLRSGRINAFLGGVFATLLATSCSAPFVGTAVGFALARGPAEILAIFLAMGLGLALPYLVGAAAPALVGLLPRPGRWMMVLANVLGLLLIGTVLWLLGVLIRVSGPRQALLLGLILLLLLGLIFLRHRAGHRRLAIGRVAGGAAAGLVVAALLVPLAGTGLPPPPLPRSDTWRPFTPAAIGANVVKGRTVLVDVTAAWCLICQVNEATVLDRDPVAKRLVAQGVVTLRADWTRPDPAITAYLQSFGRYGVPLDVVYGPAAPGGIVLPDLVTAATVLGALDRAAGASLAARR